MRYLKKFESIVFPKGTDGYDKNVKELYDKFCIICFELETQETLWKNYDIDNDDIISFFNLIQEEFDLDKSPEIYEVYFYNDEELQKADDDRTTIGLYKAYGIHHAVA